MSTDPSATPQIRQSRYFLSFCGAVCLNREWRNWILVIGIFRSLPTTRRLLIWSFSEKTERMRVTMAPRNAQEKERNMAAIVNAPYHDSKSTTASFLQRSRSQMQIGVSSWASDDSRTTFNVGLESCKQTRTGATTFWFFEVSLFVAVLFVVGTTQQITLLWRASFVPRRLVAINTQGSEVQSVKSHSRPN